MTPLQKIKQLSEGNYQLSNSHPLTEVIDCKNMIKLYNPYNEENNFLKFVAMELLNNWEHDLKLGGAIK